MRSDDTDQPGEIDEPDDSAGAPSPRPRSAAAAASRARRIGGRAASRPVAAVSAPGSPVALAKADATDSVAEDPDTGDDNFPPPAKATVVVEVPVWVRWLPAGVLSAGAVTMAILLIVISHGVWWAKPSSASVRDQVLATAKSCTVAINSYKYTDLDTYERKALACTTGGLTTDLRTAIDSIVKVKAPQLKASQTVQINNAGIESVASSGNQWTLLVFGQLKLVSSDYPKGTDAPFAAEVRVDRADGKWRLSFESTLGGESSGATGTGATPSGSATPSAPTGSATTPTGSATSPSGSH